MSQNQKKTEKNQNKQPENDPFSRLKYIAYCRNYTPIQNGDYADLLSFAKNYLCLVKNVLILDPIWDMYTEEDLLVEYYSVRMYKEDTYKDEIEASFKGKGNTVNDLADWADEEIEKYNADREKKIEEAKIDFSPSELKGED